jgi:hypothetical protein
MRKENELATIGQFNCGVPVCLLRCGFTDREPLARQVIAKSQIRGPTLGLPGTVMALLRAKRAGV